MQALEIYASLERLFLHAILISDLAMLPFDMGAWLAHLECFIVPYQLPIIFTVSQPAFSIVSIGMLTVQKKF